jgi:hypothetical protein
MTIALKYSLKSDSMAPPHSSPMCSPLVMWPKSNNIAVFALDLTSTYEGDGILLSHEEEWNFILRK